MRTLPLLVLPLVIGCGIDGDRDDGIVDEPTTSDQQQALNGDEWSTVHDDDSGTSTGFGAEYKGIAISPTTHTAVVVGGHNGVWYAFRRTVLTPWDSVQDRDAFNLGNGGIAQAVAVSSTGVFFAAGSSMDNGNPRKRHVIIRKSVDDGYTWTTALDNANHSESQALGITVDSLGNAYASGFILDSAVPATHAVVWKVPTSGASTEKVIYDGIADTRVALNGICTNGGTTIYTTGNRVLPTTPGVPFPDITTARVSADGGATWTLAFENQFRTTSAGTGCSASPDGHILFSGFALDSTASSYQTINYTPSTQSWTYASWFNSSLLNRAQAILRVGTRTYVVGTSWINSNGNWRTRFKDDGASSWTDSDTVHKTGAINIAVANAAAYQPANSALPAIFLVVGTAPDANNHAHGIVRQRTAF